MRYLPPVAASAAAAAAALFLLHAAACSSSAAAFAPQSSSSSSPLLLPRRHPHIRVAARHVALRTAVQAASARKAPLSPPPPSSSSSSRGAPIPPVVVPQLRKSTTAATTTTTTTTTRLLQSSSSSAADDPPSSKVVTSLRAALKSASSALLLILLDVQFKRYFLSKGIKSFPSSLAGCGALFATLLGLYKIKEEWGDGLYEILKPGAALLATWLPLFFVPSLITLPLARSLGGGWELAKIGTVIVGGFLFTLLTTAFSVVGVRALAESEDTSENDANETEPAADDDSKSAATPATATPPPKPFSEGTLKTLSTLAVGFGGAATLAVKNGAVDTVTTPLKTCAMLCSTLATYVFGARLPSKFTKVVHPLVTCTTLTWLAAKVLGVLTGGVPFLTMLGQYRANTLCPVHTGAGDLLLFMLGPAVISLACQMYDKKKLIADNIVEVGTAVTVSSFGGLFGTALLVRLLNIADPVLRLCLLSRNITSPLAMAIAAMLGADVSLAVSIVVVTGLIGANFGASILDAVNIKDPVARGMGIGAAAHGLGTAAFKDEKDAFPFAAISMALTASVCTVLCSLGGVRRWVLRLALGGGV